MQNNVHRVIHDPKMPGDGGPHSALDAIACHGPSKCFPHRKTNAWSGNISLRAHAVQRRNVAGKTFPGFFIYALKIRVLQQTRTPGKPCGALLRNLVGGQLQLSGEENYSRKPGFTETRLRPLARRRERTARPLLVFIRVRKPCVLDRRRRLG